MLSATLKMGPWLCITGIAAAMFCAKDVRAQSGDRMPARWPAEVESARRAQGRLVVDPANGTTSAYASANSIATTTTGDSVSDIPTLLSVTIKKGKPKSVLMINEELSNAFIVGRTGSWQNPVFGVRVNGFTLGQLGTAFTNSPMEGQTICNATADTNEILCFFPAIAWVDLDAAEAMHPGQFKGRPLQIDLQGYIRVPDADVGKPAQILLAVLTVNMQKK